MEEANAPLPAAPFEEPYRKQTQRGCGLVSCPSCLVYMAGGCCHISPKIDCQSVAAAWCASLPAQESTRFWYFSAQRGAAEAPPSATSLTTQIRECEIPFPIRIAKAKTMVSIFGFSLPFSAGFQGKSGLVFGFSFGLRERGGGVSPLLTQTHVIRLF